MQLLLATENQGKKKELVSILDTVSIECVVPSDITKEIIVFPEESGNTFSENAFIKANFLYQKYDVATLADDSGLSVVALNNFPGVKSARWMDGSDTDRVNGLLSKMENITNRTAFFTCVLCYITPKLSEEKYFEGIIEGTLAYEAKGTNGFGYDSIFIPDGQTNTLAELETTFKNKYSHRAVALQKLIDFLKKNMID